MVYIPIVEYLDQEKSGNPAQQAQIFLVGNLAIWYSGTASVAVYLVLLGFYLLRRRRLCYDLPEGKHHFKCNYIIM
jgi:dolichyl-phosphate-mannose--protein O-mannosyl transferase